MRLGRLFGIDIVVDWSWLLMALLIWTVFRQNYERAYPRQATAMAITVAVGFFVSILVHELSHSLVAKARHLPVNRIVVHIFGGASELGTDTAGPGDEFIVTVVGPTSSLMLAVAFRLADLAASGPAEPVLGYLAWLNLFVGLFNFIPAFPLDGGRVLRAAVWAATADRDQGTVVAARAGQVFSALLIGGGVTLALIRDAGALWYCFIGAMIGGTATSMLREVQGRRRVEGRTAADLMWSRPLALHPSESVARAQSVLAASPHTTLPVVDDEGRVVGLVSNDRAGAALAQGYANVPVAQLMEPVAVAVHPWTQGNDVLTALRQAGGREVVVVDAWGRLVGIVTAAAVKPPGRTRPPVGFGRSATGP